MSFTFNRTNNKIVKKTVSLTSNPTINTNVFEETYQIISATNSTITLPNTSNNNSNYYNNWYIRILSGLGINQIRQIQSYNSSTKQITLKTNLDIIPSSSDSIILYNKLNSNIIWQESNNRFAPVYIKNSSNLNQIGETIEYLDFGCNNLTILSNKQSHSTTSGSLIVNGGSGITGSVNIGNSLNVTNNINCNSLSVNGVSITGNSSNVYLTNIVPGTASASKALVLNSTSDITGINSLTTTTLVTTNLTLNGTAITASASEINKLAGTTAVTSDFNKLASVTATATELNYLDFTTGSPGIAEASKVLVLNSTSDITGINSLTTTTLVTTNLTLNGTAITASASEINKLAGTTAVTSDFNKLASVTATATELNYLDFTTGSPGIAEASKVLVLNSTLDITGINSLTTTTLVTTNLTLNGTTITASASEINKLAGTAAVTSDFNKLASITATATELNYTDITTIGTAEASKALIVDSSRNIININSLTATNLTATNLTGTIQTASQTNITSVGTLTSLTSSGNIVSSNANASFRILPHSDNIVYLQAGLNTTTGSSADIFIGNYAQATSASSRKIIIKADGKVGFGTTSPSYTLDVSGDINLTGSLRFSGTAITASATELNYNDITTIGTAQASKALILDSSSYINGINKIVFNAASTTRQVSSAGDYRCIDTNTITFNNAVTAASGTDTAHQVSNFIGRHTITATNTNVTTTTFSTFYIQGEPLNGTNMTITNKYALFINSGNSYLSGNINIAGHNGLSTGLQLNGTLVTATAAELNILDGVTATATELNYLDFITGSPGIAEASKALVLNSTSDITGINSLTTTTLVTTNLTLNGTAITASASEINKLAGTTVVTSDFNKLASVTATATELNYLDFTTGSPGIAEASKSLVLNSTLDITGINSLTTTTLITTNLTLNGIAVTASATKLNYNDITTIGTAEASKALILDSSRNISNINSISLNGFNDVITLTNLGSGNRTNIRFINDARSWELGSRGSTNSNANSFYLYDNTASAYRLIVNSSGSVNIVNHNGSSTGLQLNGTLITSTAAELNVLDGITATTTELNILDGVTATTAELNILDGITATTAELNILDGVTATTAELNILDGVTATTAELNILDGVTATTAELNFLDITSAGTALASKALILDSSRYINGINKIVFNVASTTRQVSSPGDYRCIDTNTITFNNAVTVASGTDTTHQVSNFIGRHTITATNTNVTTTTFSTFYIQGEPLNGTNMTITNKYALFINSGNSYLSGNINIAGHNGSSTGLQLNGTLVTATAAELNILDGVTATTAELNYLDITSTGTAQASKALVLDSSSNITGINNLSLTGTLTIGTVGSGPNRINFSGTTLDSNTNHTVIAERIYGGTEQSELLIFKGNDPASTPGPDRIRLRASEFRFQTYTSAEDFSGLNDNNDRLYIANNGNIGIGTTSPGYLLEVNGRIAMTSNGYGYSHFSGNGGELNTYVTSSLTGIGSYTNTDFGIYTGGFGNMRMRIYTNGNAYFTNYVGIGQSSPNWPLDVNMFLNTSLSNSSGERFASTSYTGYNYNNTAWGNVSAKFSNDIVSTGFIAISDKRLKTNIENINDQYCLDFIKYIQPKSYNMKIDLDNNINNTKFGFIAQDLIKYGFNNMVTYIDENNSEYESYKYLIEDQESPEHIKLSVSYNDIIPILTRNIQIISNEKKILEEKVNILENENNQLKVQINQILERLQNLENNN